MKPLSNSFEGILYVFRHEPNFRWRLAFSGAAIALGIYLEISYVEMLILLVSIAMMLMAEIANTALEEVCDILEPEFNLRIKAIKDMLSATVFIAALPALGILLFAAAPRLLSVF
jgi:diacylglycerol kinase (ATP)